MTTLTFPLPLNHALNNVNILAYTAVITDIIELHKKDVSSFPHALRGEYQSRVAKVGEANRSLLRRMERIGMARGAERKSVDLQRRVWMAVVTPSSGLCC
jgi:hypothetical protein